MAPTPRYSESARRSRAARGWADGMSQKALSQRLGHPDQQFVQRAESDSDQSRGYKRSDLIAIAEITSTPLEFMLDGWEGVRRAAEMAFFERVQRLAEEDAENGRTIDPASVAVTMRLLRAALALREGPSAEAQTP